MQSRRSVADVRLLNRQRWASHMATQESATTPWGTNNQQRSVPTAGALFNRPNPIAHDHERGGREYVTRPYNRKLDKFLKHRGEKRAIRPDGTYMDDYDESVDEQRAQLDPRNWNRDATVADATRDGQQVKLMPVYGSDAFAVNPASVHKRRIPNTSVVNKIGDLRVPFCCWGVRLTAAQWIWYGAPAPMGNCAPSSPQPSVG